MGVVYIRRLQHVEYLKYVLHKCLEWRKVQVTLLRPIVTTGSHVSIVKNSRLGADFFKLTHAVPVGPHAVHGSIEIRKVKNCRDVPWKLHEDFIYFLQGWLDQESIQIGNGDNKTILILCRYNEERQ